MITQIKQIFAFTVLFLCALQHASQANTNIETHFESDSSVPLVEIALVFPGGSSLDPSGKEGLTDFVAEMLFRGTINKSKKVLDSSFDDIAAQTTVETRLESTIIRAKVLASAFETLGNLLIEVLTQPAFHDSEIIKFKHERIASLLDEKSNDKAISGKLFTQFIFPNHTYGRSVEGTPKSIQSVSKAELFSHLQNIIRKNGLIVLGQGKIESNHFLAWVKRLQDLLNDGINYTPVLAPTFPTEKRLLLIHKPDRTQTQIWMGLPGVKMSDSNYVPLTVANHIFGGPSFQSVLMKEIRVKRGWSYGAGSAFRFGTQPRSWHMYFFPAERDTAPAVTVGQQLLRNFADTGVTEDQFDFAKTSIIKNSGFNTDTPSKRMENKILEVTLGLPEGFIANYAEQVKRVNQTAVQNAIRSTFDSNLLQIAVLGTMKPKLKSALIEAAGVTPKQVKEIAYDFEP